MGRQKDTERESETEGRADQTAETSWDLLSNMLMQSAKRERGKIGGRRKEQKQRWQSGGASALLVMLEMRSAAHQWQMILLYYFLFAVTAHTHTHKHTVDMQIQFLYTAYLPCRL